MKENEFDLDFDFEKEYGFDLPKEEEAANPEEDFDLRAILESDFTEEAALFNAEYQNDFDYGPEETAEEAAPAEELPQETVEEFFEEYEEYPEVEQRSIEDLMAEEDLAVAEDAPEEIVPEEVPEAPVRRRERKGIKLNWNPLKQRPAPEPKEPAEDAPKKKPMSKSRQFKNETLPLIIIGVAAALIVFFVVGAASRAITTAIRTNQDQQQAQESKLNEEERLAMEAQTLLDEAALLAAGYNYEAAIA